MPNRNFAAACVAALLMSTAAHGDDSGTYFGASLGEATQSSFAFAYAF